MEGKPNDVSCFAQHYPAAVGGNLSSVSAWMRESLFIGWHCQQERLHSKASQTFSMGSDLQNVLSKEGIDCSCSLDTPGQ